MLLQNIGKGVGSQTFINFYGIYRIFSECRAREKHREKHNMW